MALTELLSVARALPRTEQLRLIQELAAGLLQDENPDDTIAAGRDYAVWSPDAAYSAAEALLGALATPEVRS